MTKLGLIGDPHASSAPVAEALEIFKQQQVDEIWCTGDIAGYGDKLAKTIALLQDSGCQSILGNHEVWYLEKESAQANNTIQLYLNTLPRVIDKEIQGQRIYMVHASPPESMMEGIKLLDQYGQIVAEEKHAWTERLSTFDYDVLIIGHTHQAFAERLGEVLVINPGSSRFNHSCAILEIPSLRVHWFALSGQSIQRSWNWGAGLAQSLKGKDP